MDFILRLLLTVSLGIPTVAFGDCDLDIDGVRKYEHRILNEKSTAARTAAFDCLFEIQQKADHEARYLANAYLRVLLGGPLVKDVPKNSKHQAIAKDLEELSLKGDRTALQFANGDWQFYKLFCEEGNVAHCATMVPTEDLIEKQAPLIAAGSLLHLRQAYLVLNGQQKEQIAQRIRNLYDRIPKQAKVQRKFIDQIYAELFGPQIPLGMLS